MLQIRGLCLAIAQALGSSASVPSFYLNLSNATNASIADSQGRGTITGGGGGTITISATTTTLTGTAPFNVVFDASGTTATGVAKPFHNCFYVWDFGDDQSTYWANGAYVNQNKNTEYGPIASHVFQNAGSKTVTLYVYDGSGNSASQTFAVTVNAADTVYSGTNTIVFSTSGTFTGKPTGAQEVTTSSLNTAIGYKAANKRLLFRAGETWTASGAAVDAINVNGMQIGKFGSGADPIWSIPDTVSLFGVRVGADAGCSGFAMYDIDMEGGNGQNNLGFAGAANIDNCLFLRCKANGFGNGASFPKGSVEGTASHKIWDNLAFVDCTIDVINNSVGAGSKVGAYLSATNMTFMGNYMDNHGGGEHVFRTPYIAVGCIKHNYMANPDGPGGKHCWQLHAPSQTDSGGAIGTGKYTEKLNIGNNVFSGGTGTGWVTSIGPQNVSVDERIRNVIIDGNYFKKGSSSGSYGYVVRGDVQYVTIRNNIINMSLAAANGVGGEIDGTAGNSVSGNTSRDVDVVNNTIYCSTTDLIRGYVFTASPLNCRAINNLCYAPGSTLGGVIYGTGGTGWSASNNSTVGDAQATSPGFSTIPAFATNHLITTDFKPSTSRTHGAGITDIATRDDLFHITRTGTMDLGAVQA